MARPLWNDLTQQFEADGVTVLAHFYVDPDGITWARDPLQDVDSPLAWYDYAKFVAQRQATDDRYWSTLDAGPPNAIREMQRNVEAPACDCGSAKIKAPGHSSWCSAAVRR